MYDLDEKIASLTNIFHYLSKLAIINYNTLDRVKKKKKKLLQHLKETALMPQWEPCAVTKKKNSVLAAQLTRIVAPGEGISGISGPTVRVGNNTGWSAVRSGLRSWWWQRSPDRIPRTYSTRFYAASWVLLDWQHSWVEGQWVLLGSMGWRAIDFLIGLIGSAFLVVESMRSSPSGVLLQIDGHGSAVLVLPTGTRGNHSALSKVLGGCVVSWGAVVSHCVVGGGAGAAGVVVRKRGVVVRGPLRGRVVSCRRRRRGVVMGRRLLRRIWVIESWWLVDIARTSLWKNKIK